MKKTALILFGLFAATIAFEARLAAATHEVQMRDFSFTPRTLTIDVGDTVTWRNVQGSHDVQSNTPLFRSPFPIQGTFSFTFNTAGTFAYRCNPHINFGMTGTITVRAAANTPPVVAITSPTNNATFTAPATIVIEATATDNGSVASVEFFAGAISFGTDTTAPFSISTNLSAGNHILTAKATDNLGAATTSAPVNISITEPPSGPIVFASPAVDANGRFTCQITGLGGKRSEVQVSSDLLIWTTLQTIEAPGSPLLFEDSATTGVPARHYRVRQ